MNDFLQNELKEGDEVVCLEVNLKRLVKGRVVKINPKTVLVSYYSEILHNFCNMKRSSNQVVKYAHLG